MWLGVQKIRLSLAQKAAGMKIRMSEVKEAGVQRLRRS